MLKKIVIDIINVSTNGTGTFFSGKKPLDVDGSVDPPVGIRKLENEISIFLLTQPSFSFLMLRSTVISFFCKWIVVALWRVC